MIAKPALFILALTAVSACAIDENAQHAPDDVTVVVTPTNIPFDPLCGAGFADERTQVIRVEPARITPADQNSIVDVARLELPTDFPSGGTMRLQRLGSCDNTTTLGFDAVTTAVEWDGKTDQDSYAEPGQYVIMIGGPDSEITAVGQVVIGVQDDVCVVRQADIQPLHETRVVFDALGFHEDLSVDVPSRGHLCLVVERLAGSRMVPFVGIDGVPLVTNRSYSIDTEELLVSQPVWSDQVQLRVGGANGSYRVRLGLIADDSVDEPVPTSHSGEDMPRSLTCRGRLQSYAHPFGEERPHWPGLDETVPGRDGSAVPRFENGRRPVAREGVLIQCTAVFRRRDPGEETTYAYRRSTNGARPDIPALYAPAALNVRRPDTGTSRQALARRADTFIPGFPGFSFYPGLVDDFPEPFPPPDPREVRSISATGLTDATGAYEITLNIGDILESMRLSSLNAKCRWDNDCGGGWFAYSTDDITYDGPLDVIDVFDVQQGRRKARLITNAGTTPVTAGQIRRPVLEPLVFANAAAIDEILDTQPTIFRDSVALPAEMNDYPLVIHEPFDPLAEDAFDYMVWLLGGQPVSFQDFSKDGFEMLGHDNGCQLDRENLCYGYAGKCDWIPSCSASSLPVNCNQQNILKSLLEGGYDIWLVDHGYESSVINVAHDAPYIYQQVIRYPWVDGERRIAVSGLSSGGVAARIALTMWERQDELPDLIADNDLQLLRPFAPGTLTEGIDKVAAYFSLDSPHRGAIVPVALQAFMHDSGFPEDSRLPDLLESQSARELLRNHVDPSVETLCFAKPPADCDVRPSTPEAEEVVAAAQATSAAAGLLLRRLYVDPDKVSRTDLDQLLRETIEVLGTGRAGTFWEEAFPDGLPRTPKSFAIANSWRYGRGPEFDAPEFLKADIKVRGTFRTKTYDYDLFDFAQQPRGSTNPTVCKAYGLAGSPPEEHIFLTALGNCITDITELGIMQCLVTAGIKSFFDALIGNDSYDTVRVNMEIPMRYPTFIPTESAMNFVDGPGSVGRAAFGFEDALWRKRNPDNPDEKPVHFDVTEEACKFVRYHLDGTLKGDRDGVPACRSNMLASCANGGMLPGDLLDAGGDYEENLLEYCDCDESTTLAMQSRACSVLVLPGGSDVTTLRE